MTDKEIARVLSIMIKDAIAYGFTLNPHTLNVALFEGKLKND